MEFMRLYKHRDVYYVQFPGGKRRSLKTKDKRKAKGLFSEIEKEYLRGNLLKLEKGSGTVLSCFKKLYISDPERADLSPNTHRADDQAIKRLIDAIGDIPIDTIGKTHIARFKQICKSRGVKPVSINTYCRHIRAALNYALENEYIQSVPKIKTLKVGDSLPRIISPKDLDKILIQACKKKLEMYRIIQMVLYTGARRAEIIKMRHEHIHNDFITIYGKGNKERVVMLLDHVKNILEPQHIGKIFSYKHVSTISNYYRKITRAAGVKSRFHDLRHTAATQMLNNGISLEVVQKILGHAEIRTTQIYAKVMQKTLAKEMEKLQY